MTELEYQQKNLTKWDRFKGNSFLIPVVILIILILAQMFEVINYETTRAGVGLFVITFAISVGLRISLVKKLDRLKMEYLKSF